MPEMLQFQFQDVVVTLTAVAAVWVIVRRVTSAVGPGPRRTASCTKCASASPATPKGDAATRPLTLVRDRR